MQLGLAALDGSARDASADIIDIGRDLYYATRCATPNETGEQTRLALLAALKALNVSDHKADKK